MRHFYYFLIAFLSVHASLASYDSTRFEPFIKKIMSGKNGQDILLRFADSLYNTSKLEQRQFLSDVNLKAKNAGNRIIEAHSSNLLALTYLDFGLYSEAYKQFNSAFKIYSEEKNKTGVFNTYSNMGNMYFFMGDIKRSLIYHLKSYQYFKANFDENKDAARGASSCINLGSVYGTMNNLPLAKIYFYKALDYYKRDKDKDSITLALIMNNIGDVHMTLKEYDTAKKFLDISCRLKLLYGNVEQKADAWNSMGVYYYNVGQQKKAEEYLLKTIPFFDTTHPESDLLKYYSNLADVYSKLGDYKKENLFLKLNYKTSQFLDSVGKVSEIEANEIKLQLRQQSVNDSIQNQAQIRIRDVKLQQKKRESIYGILALVAVSIVAFLFFNRYKLTRKQKIEIEEQKHFIEEKNKEIRDSITYAQNLQNALIPDEDELVKSGTEAFVIYLPKDIVAGDFYWIHNVEGYSLDVKGSERITNNPQLVLVAAADCTGHGVPGAMVSVVCINALNRAVNEFNLIEPNEILDKVNALVNETFSKNNKQVNDGMDISLLLIDKNRGEVKWSGANNQLISFYKGEMKITRADKQPIGKNENHKPFRLHTFPLEKGTVYYLVTDGFADQFGGEKNKKMGISRLKTLMTEHHDKQMKEQKVIFESAFKQWKNDTEQTDDVSLIGIRV
ncbi:MAG: hypothetical protein K0S32_1281 [Bacteroidetes bacterium]|nr:hypothetical protein [Bacteroidota bacterium]